MTPVPPLPLGVRFGSPLASRVGCAVNTPAPGARGFLSSYLSCRIVGDGTTDRAGGF